MTQKEKEIYNQAIKDAAKSVRLKAVKMDDGFSDEEPIEWEIDYDSILKLLK